MIKQKLLFGHWNSGIPWLLPACPAGVASEGRYLGDWLLPLGEKIIGYLFKY